MISNPRGCNAVLHRERQRDHAAARKSELVAARKKQAERERRKQAAVEAWKRRRQEKLLEQGPPLASTRGIGQLEGWAATDHRPQTDQAATRLGVAGAPFERQLEALRRSSEVAESEGVR